MIEAIITCPMCQAPAVSHYAARAVGPDRDTLVGLLLDGFIMEHESMTHAVAGNRRSVLWLVAIFALAGLYLGFTSHGSLDPLVTPTIALLFVLAGLLFIFPLAAFGPRNEYERRSRIRVAVVGAGQVVFGVAQLIPSLTIRMILVGMAALFMLGGFRGIPKRLFAPRGS